MEQLGGRWRLDEANRVQQGHCGDETDDEQAERCDDEETALDLFGYIDIAELSLPQTVHGSSLLARFLSASRRAGVRPTSLRPRDRA